LLLLLLLPGLPRQRRRLAAREAGRAWRAPPEAAMVCVCRRVFTTSSGFEQIAASAPAQPPATECTCRRADEFELSRKTSQRPEHDKARVYEQRPEHDKA
jgi:hypothetical protein